MAEIWAVIKLLPEIFGVLKQVVAFLKNTVGDGDPKKFLRDVGESFSKYNAAKTDEEKVDALRSLQSIFLRT